MWYQLVVLCCLCALWRLWSKKPSVPEPPQLSGNLPIVGNTFRLLGNGVKMYKSLRSIAEECLQKGGLIIINLGPRKVYAVADPEDSLLISNQCLQKNFVYDFTKPYFGDGLITVDAIKWKTNRKLLNPAFNQQVLDGFVAVFNTQARSLVDHFAAQIGKPFDHNYLLRLNNLETICTTALGVDSSKYSELQKQYLPRIETLLRLVNERMQKFWLYSDFIFNMTQQKKTLDKELNHVLALSKSIIKDKRAERRNKISNAGKFKPFVDLILDLADDNGCFTDEYIRGEIDTIIGAGHDTIASLMSFVLPVLGSHADVQEKAYNEILDVIGTKKNNIEAEDLSKLVYIEAVLKETLRLYSVVPIQGRRIDKDVKLKNYTVKENTDCFLFIDGLHRHSIWGADAEEFRPERWLDKETLPNTKYFGGFGVGRRSCIGKTYAMMSMKITLAHVLQNYSISSDVSKMLVTMQMVTKPESGHFITLAHRNTT